MFSLPAIRFAFTAVATVFGASLASAFCSSTIRLRCIISTFRLCCNWLMDACFCRRCISLCLLSRCFCIGSQWRCLGQRGLAPSEGDLC